MNWARIENGVVREIISDDPAGRFHDSIRFEQCGDEVEEGWEVDENGVFSKPDESTEIDISALTESEKRELYKSYCKAAIAKIYSVTDELKLLRRNAEYFSCNGHNSEEFDEYNDYVQQCLMAAHAKVYEQN